MPPRTHRLARDVRSAGIPRVFWALRLATLGPRQAGFTLVELLIVIAIVSVLVAVAVPPLVHSRRLGNEASAVASLTAINEAQVVYRSTCGNDYYSASLVALGVPNPSTGQAFLSPDLTAAELVAKGGYLIRMSGTPVADAPPTCNGAPASSGYQATADPLRPGLTGTRSFGTNASRTIFEHSSSLVGQMPESGAPSAGTVVR